MTDSTAPRPVEITRANTHDVKIIWSDNSENIYPARFLRLACPCAECIEEMTGRKRLRDEAVPKDIHPLTISPVGRYAIQIQWSDGHQTGIYTWEKLFKLAGDLPA